MQQYLQPAGYEFEKIASDFAQLREGKSMFDGDALAAIRSCTDRNALGDTIERFAEHVLPHYDDLVAQAPEIIDALANAAVRAITMPDVPRKTYFGEYFGTKPETIVAQVCRILESGYLLYADPDRMFDVLVAMRAAAQTDEQRKPIDDLTKRFAQHDLRAWRHGGPWLQRVIVDKIKGLADGDLIKAAPTATKMLGRVLTSSVTGTTWKADTVTLHTGAVRASDALKAVRHDAIDQLKRLHGLTGDEDSRADVRRAMEAAGDTPNNAGYSDELGVIIMDDLTDVVGFFSGVVPSMDLERTRRIEVELFRIFYRYHALPAEMRNNSALVEAQTRLFAAIKACREIIDADEDLARYRVLVGHDSVSRAMWDEAKYDHRASAKERSSEIDAMVQTVGPASEVEWLGRLERFVETRSDDMATFMGLGEFIKKVGSAAPSILIGWLPRLSDRLARWLPGMLHSLAEAGRADEIQPLIDGWVASDKHLSSIAWYLQFSEKFNFDFLVSITDKALAANDDETLGNVAKAAARQSTRFPNGLFDRVFVPAANALTERGDFRWLHGWFNWEEVGLLNPARIISRL
jgi:hypothetical protein